VLLSDYCLRYKCISGLTTGWSDCMKQSEASPLASTLSQTAKDPGVQSGSEFSKATAPNNSLCFLYLVDLTSIAREILKQLYSADAGRAPWSLVELTIKNSTAKADAWLSNLPDVFNFTLEQSSHLFLQQRLRLAFQFYSTRICLSYPCLYPVNQTSQYSNGSFHHTFAILCVESACHALELIPKEPSASAMSTLTPWWCLLHYIVQAATVLLLELSFGVVHMPHKKVPIFDLTKKAIRWLLYMSNESTASHRAWVFCDIFIRRIAPNIGMTVDELPNMVCNSFALPSLSGLHSLSDANPTYSNSIPSQDSVFGDTWIPPTRTTYDDILTCDPPREEFSPFFLSMSGDMDLGLDEGYEVFL